MDHLNIDYYRNVYFVCILNRFQLSDDGEILNDGNDHYAISKPIDINFSEPAHNFHSNFNNRLTGKIY